MSDRLTSGHFHVLQILETATINLCGLNLTYKYVYTASGRFRKLYNSQSNFYFFSTLVYIIIYRIILTYELVDKYICNLRWRKLCSLIFLDYHIIYSGQ